MLVVQNCLKVMKARSQCVESRERAAEADTSSIEVEVLNPQLCFSEKMIMDVSQES